MGKLGMKGLLLLSALAVAWPAAVPAQANGAGSAPGGAVEEDTSGKAGSESDATGSIGGKVPAPAGTTSGGTGTDATSPPAKIPGDGSRLGSPCPSGYILSEDGHMCARP